jgi:hypothetical protein
MSQHAPATPGNSHARQIAFYFGAIADTTDWEHADWQALSVRLQASGTPIASLTLHQVHVAIAATVRAARKDGA